MILLKGWDFVPPFFVSKKFPPSRDGKMYWIKGCHTNPVHKKIINRYEKKFCKMESLFYICHTLNTNKL